MNRGVRILLLAIIPATVGLFVLREPLIEMLSAWRLYASRCSGYGANVALPSRSSLDQRVSPNVGQCLFFSEENDLGSERGRNFSVSKYRVEPLVGRLMQQRGLALANSLSGLFNLILLTVGFFTVLKLHHKTSLPVREMALFVSRVSIAGIGMGLVINKLSSRLAASWSGFHGLIISTLLSVVLGLGIYVVFTYILGVEETRLGLKWSVRKLEQMRGNRNE